MSVVITLIYVVLGFIYSAVYFSLYTLIIRYFDTTQPVGTENWITWGIFIGVAALVASVIEKLLTIFDLREHESLLDTDPVTGVIEILTQAVPAFFRGTLWAGGILIINGIAGALLPDLNIVRDIASGLGLPL
ncbi:hypothetical protein [Oceanidesulfovibrio marinus]|uniref:Uncharacterized protein n=1 Tax=Oceanidesulfovibrio marinus TaxID=370038 RepID=A0A6P1ZG22_9BACT|nr:hypothetical protein [Oceanidesulfovibrio marinus]QJT09485.1 hypothetical protein E8L03_11280 [Oceanidesulfovibrio marinus]TVM33710.1 hypothetical protein DQK91_10830 [Oceanidesulfovibrio marinus]